MIPEDHSMDLLAILQEKVQVLSGHNVLTSSLQVDKDELEVISMLGDIIEIM